MSVILSPKTAVPAAHSSRLHLDFLDGLRAVAALMVMLSHIWRSYTKQPLPGFQGWLVNWMGLQGHVWVDVFIVLSGFCLMLPVARTHSLRGGWRAFYLSRARRILPPLYAVLALVTLRSILLHWGVPKLSLLANLLLLQDIWQSKDTLDGPLWSVAVEWKIYFLFPFFVWLWQRYGPPVVLLTSAVISAILFGIIVPLHIIPDMTHLCPWYVFLFAMGMISAEVALRPVDHEPGWSKPLLLFGGLLAWEAVSWFWPRNIFHTPVSDVVTGFIASLLLLMLTCAATEKKKTPLVSILSWQPLVFIGTFAYSLYLIHVLLIYTIRGQLERLPYHPAFIVIPIDMAIVVGIAYLFHLAFERPFMSKPGQSAPKTERQAEVAAIVNPAP